MPAPGRFSKPDLPGACPAAGLRITHAPFTLRPMPPNWDESTWDSSNWDSPSVPPFQPLPDKKRKTNRRTMASNPTPDDEAVLLALAEDLADGCHDLEVTIGIKQNTEAVMRAAITGLTDASLALGTAEGLATTKHDDMLAADALQIQ